MKYIYLFIVLQLIIVQGYSQQKKSAANYRSPIDLPLYLSGTFGELRSDHFHSGVDIRVGGKEGLPVYAIADGYVSRIAVSPVGFGKAVYIDHPATGHTSVYAHLQRFKPDLAQWVKTEQYAQQKFGVNLLPDRNKFPVKKGDIIGYAGDSGSSGGPHLHFEIRDAASQEILNPLAHGYTIKDFIKPFILRLAVYPEGKESEVNSKNKASFYQVEGWGEQHRIKDNKVIKASGSVTFGITADDTHNETPNTNGVYSIELWIDSTQIFGFSADRFSFDETRYINSMIDYAYLADNKSRIVRTKIDPFNKLGMYNHVRSNGVLKLQPGDSLKALYIVKDYNGNTSKLPFTLVGVQGKSVKTEETIDTNSVEVIAGKAFTIKEKTFEAAFPDDAFYTLVQMAKKAEKSSSHFSDIITLGSKRIPVHKNYKLRIKVNEKKLNREKLTIVQLDNENKNPIGGVYEAGWMTVNTRRLGRFVVMADTIPPAVSALNFKNLAQVDSLKVLKVSLKDDFSGINDIKPSLNGEWLLMDYDPKNKLLTYEVDERLKKGENIFRLIVTDQCNNKTVFEAKVKK